MTSEIIRTLTSGDKPLCPNSTNAPIHEAHQLHTRVVDAFYNAAEKDDEGEMSAPLDKAYSAAAYGSVSDNMELFVAAASFPYRSEFVRVESWWWKCPVCGFVLPANRVTT